ncbi:MAG: TetR/AcrR family transcriptional regulator [Candidatus Krumholzibacteria bacterium]|nr:TetR/AcrR family transcriptional regulator [Candidatus Krumholzibacteria bacterium]
MNSSLQKPSSRTRILEAAADEFIQYGLSGGRVDRIAKRARVNKAMIYYYFSSKDNLYQAIIDAHLGRLGDELQASIDESAGLEENLLAISRIYLRVLTENSRYLPIMLRELAADDSTFRKSLERMVSERSLPERFLAMLEEGKRSGRFRDCDNRQAVISFMGMNLFYLLLAPIVNSIWKIGNEEEFREKRPREVVELFMRGIERRDSNVG